MLNMSIDNFFFTFSSDVDYVLYVLFLTKSYSLYEYIISSNDKK